MSLATEYESFEYKQFDEPALSLEQATEKASHLRRSDSNHVYRVAPMDADMSGFRIEEIPIQAAYSEVWMRLCKHFLRYISPSFRER